MPEILKDFIKNIPTMNIVIKNEIFQFDCIKEKAILSHLDSDDIELLEDSGVAMIVLSPVFTDIDGDSLVYNVTISEEHIISTAISG